MAKGLSTMNFFVSTAVIACCAVLRTLGTNHQFSRCDRDKLGACVAVPENQSFLLLQISKDRLINHRGGIFQARRSGTGTAATATCCATGAGSGTATVGNCLGFWLRFSSRVPALRPGARVLVQHQRVQLAPPAWSSGSGSTAGDAICSSGCSSVTGGADASAVSVSSGGW